MNKSKLLTIVGLLLFCIVVFLPPLIHGYVYPNIGDDTAGHLAVFDSMQRGLVNPQVQYLGYVMVGYPLGFVSSLVGVDIDVLFLWFTYGVLALTGVVIYLVMSKLVGRLTGWLALLIVLFCTQGLLFQFYFGQIFNLINVGLIFPLLLYFTTKYLVDGKRSQLILVFLLVGLFSSFHTSGIYLPAISGVALLGYLIYCRMHKQKIYRRVIVLGSTVIMFGGLIFVVAVLLPTVVLIERYSGYEEPFVILAAQIGRTMAVPIGSYMMSIVSITVLVLSALVIVYVKELKWNLKSQSERIITLILASGIVVLGIVTFSRLSVDPWRQALDLATILALFIAVCVGLILRGQRTRLVMLVVFLSIGFGLWHNLPTWFDYNSAIRPVDLEALAYADNFQTYSSSGTIAPWIYSRFTDAEWVGDEGDIVLERNKPMTPRSDEDNIWYQKHGWVHDSSYELAKVFSDGKVTIEIYERKAEYR